MQQLQQQENSIAPILSDSLLVQPSREEQPITPIHYTIGVHVLASLNRDVVRVNLQALKNRLTPDILKAESRERHLIALVG